MVAPSFFNGIAINLLLPLLGVIYYFYLAFRMKQKQIAEQPILSLFFVFLTYGALLIVGLTFIFWQWSGMVLLGVCYLGIIAPFLMLIIIFTTWNKWRLSIYHKTTFILAIAYLLFLLILFIVMSFLPSYYFDIY